MRQNDKENPFIHLFQTAFGYYLYDVNTNQIIKIKQDTYERLSNQEKGYKTDTNEEIEILYENGYLKNNKVQKCKSSVYRIIAVCIREQNTYFDFASNSKL